MTSATSSRNVRSRTHRPGQSGGASTSYAKCIGRISALAVALGIGSAVANAPGLALADSNAGSSSSSSGSSPSSSNGPATGSAPSAAPTSNGSTASSTSSLELLELAERNPAHTAIEGGQADVDSGGHSRGADFGRNGDPAQAFRQQAGHAPPPHPNHIHVTERYRCKV